MHAAIKDKKSTDAFIQGTALHVQLDLCWCNLCSIIPNSYVQRKRTWLWVFWGCVFASRAMLSKMQGITVIAICQIFELTSKEKWVVRSIDVWSRLLRGAFRFEQLILFKIFPKYINPIKHRRFKILTCVWYSVWWPRPIFILSTRTF